jgi:hypothetical protein
VKALARTIAVGSILLGIFLVTRTYRLERLLASTMPRSRDSATGRTLPEVLGRDGTIFVSEGEAKALDTSRTYSTFGWPFAVLGVLLAAASRDRKRPIEAAPESESPWTARR